MHDKNVTSSRDVEMEIIRLYWVYDFIMSVQHKKARATFIANSQKVFHRLSAQSDSVSKKTVGKLNEKNSALAAQNVCSAARGNLLPCCNQGCN